MKYGPMMTNEQAKAFLEEVFRAVMGPEGDLGAIDRYFTKDYVQDTNGRLLSRKDFENHLATLKASLASIRVEYTSVLVEGNRIADVH